MPSDGQLIVIAIVLIIISITLNTMVTNRLAQRIRTLQRQVNRPTELQKQVEEKERERQEKLAAIEEMRQQLAEAEASINEIHEPDKAPSLVQIARQAILDRRITKPEKKQNKEKDLGEF